jgi:hypothetical protein
MPLSTSAKHQVANGLGDPDGNSWLLPEVTTCLPGRIAGVTAYASSPDHSLAANQTVLEKSADQR